MLVNADKPHLWKNDAAASIDLYNDWFMRSAPKTYREVRTETIERVQETIRLTKNLILLNAETLKANPSILPILRMCTAPPIAKDRLVGLAYVSKHLVLSMEQGKIPPRMSEEKLIERLLSIAEILAKLLDYDIFPWLERKTAPTDLEQNRASTIVADRLCGTVSDPIIRNAQEQRQLALIAAYLKKRNYTEQLHKLGLSFRDLLPGTFAFRLNVLAGRDRTVNVPVDVVVQPHGHYSGDLPILIEAKSAGDFTNTNKRRKEEATKVNQLRARYGEDIQFILFLCGYFDAGYLGYEAAEGIDWIWEHRIEDMELLGI
ncbi:XamI family restriction endonuclease [Candidatus Poribacteria bacterium]|nr:XamI family restriction endonuclease [Candidatus Poribacteria bacterium]